MQELLRSPLILGMALGALAPCAAAEREPARAAKLRVVVIGAHPDDPESGCGGLIATLTRGGHEVIAAYTTCFRGDRKIDGEPETTVRRREATAACRVLGARAYFFDYAHDKLAADKATLEAVSAWLTRIRPDVVVTHWPLDTHDNHHVTSSLVWQCYLRQKHWSLYFFEVMTDRQTLGFRPELYLDISGVRALKEKALNCHRSQGPGAIWEVHDAMHRKRGAECGLPYAEAYVQVGAGGGRPVLPVRWVSRKDSLAALRVPATRPFRLGFTRWPSDLTLESFQAAQQFAHDHGDIVSVMFIGGIPWPEALEGRPFSKDVQNNLGYQPPSGKKLFLSISPLDKERRGLAPYWGEKDNQPLPKPWAGRALNSPEVKKAFLNFTLWAVATMKPDYLAIGVESNVLLSHGRARWQQLKELHRATYAAVKARYPKLSVFFTTEVLHYKKLASEAKGSDQEGEVADLMKTSDLFAMSVYPHMSYDVPRPVPADFLDFATRFKKPIAVSESGMTSRDVELKAFKLTLRGSEADQEQFTRLLLKTATRDRYGFVINFATTDFEKLCAKLPPPLDDVGRIWAYTGMQTSGQKPKPALAVWDGFLKAKYERGK
jgi:LmbE family N-acetylglucosaminyl deacetylase